MNVKLVDDTTKINNYEVYDNITDDDLTREHSHVIRKIFEDVCLFQLHTKELEDRLKNILSIYFPKVSKFNLTVSPYGFAQLTFGNSLCKLGPNHD